jgi:SRSO17 transposase
MERRFRVRKAQLLAGCTVKDELFEGALEQLREFVDPFAQGLLRSETRAHVLHYVQGLLSDLGSKNAESIAYLHGLDRQAIQHFVGSAAWDHEPLIEELVRQVASRIGENDGVIVFDPSAHEKKGDESVGVAKQYSGRHAKITNCQLGIYMAYASRKEHALVDERLFLSKEWARDKERRSKCGVPKGVRHRRRQDLALDMLRAHGKLLPHGWVTGDDEMGRPSRFRRALGRMRERYLMAVPSNLTIRDLDGRRPVKTAKGGPKRKRRFEQMRAWLKHRPANSWTRVHVRDAERGPIVVECMKRRVQAKTERRTPGPEELMFVVREPVSDGFRVQFHLSNADLDTPLEELARVANTEHRVEECLQRAKGQVGLSDYEVRTWRGWHHHHALAFMAAWFLTECASRGKKGDARDHRPAGESRDRGAAA